jgi:predicted Zn-dependent protease with MMP-like domain
LLDKMARVTNFGDPSFEPTDEELAELMSEAFADVPARSAAALARIRREIEELSAQAMARLERQLGDSR